ncbi:MAG: TRAP transporter small permease subunit [Halobacteriovoraceae bacterium]|nr:TRAP transporter small permease subunit [Halobacteriovoraceae bacterium]
MAKSRFSSPEKIISAILLKIGSVFSYASLMLVGVIILQVALRYGMNRGLIVLEELQWHLYAILIIPGFSLASIKNSHVRIDVLSQHFKPKTKAWVEIFGIVFLLIPFLIITFYHSLDFVADSFRTKESSPSPGGMPLYFPIKALIPLGMAMALLSSFCNLSRSFFILKDENGS